MSGSDGPRAEGESGEDRRPGGGRRRLLDRRGARRPGRRRIPGRAPEPATRPPAIPEPGFAPGWAKAGPLRTFTGQDLFNQIDGGAELFLEFGFVRLRLQAYARGKAELTLNAYEMESAASALGVYLMKMGRETPFPEVAARNSSEEVQLTIVKGRYFVQVDNLGDVPASKAEAVALANAFLAGVAEETGRDAARRSSRPRAGCAGSERLIRGPYGLQPYFTFGEGDILSLGGRIFGALAEYRMPDGTTFTRLIVPYPDRRCGGRRAGPSQSQPRPLSESHRRPARRFRFRRFPGQEGHRRPIRRTPRSPFQDHRLACRASKRAKRESGDRSSARMFRAMPSFS